ncbi:MAG: MFS transporter [Rhodobacteraceae bacterium]|nr:MFS transporter [Paracoccaceae bacterium]
MFFDWASQPFFTLLLTFIFAPYFVSSVVGDPVLGQQVWGWMLTFVGMSIAVTAPLLGSVADGTGTRRIWIIGFSALCASSAFALWWALPGSNYHWPLIFFGLCLVGAECATVLVNAMLPALGPRKDVGLISGAGWAFGYAGGILSLIIILIFFAENEAGVTIVGNPPAFGLDPESREGTRTVGPFAAIWFVLFMLPFFLWCRDKPQPVDGETLNGLLRTIRRLPREPSLFAFLGSSMLYRDALNGLYAFGGIYAAGVLGWSVVQTGMFGVAILVCGTVFTWCGGYADRHWGPKPVITVSILLLTVVCAMIFATSRDMVFGIPVAPTSRWPDFLFIFCGCVIGGAGGTIQAASRSMMTRQANPRRMTEAFGIYAFAGKATSFIAPFMIALTTAITGDQRLGVTPLILLFLLGLWLLRWVSHERITE